MCNYRGKEKTKNIFKKRNETECGQHLKNKKAQYQLRVPDNQILDGPYYVPSLLWFFPWVGTTVIQTPFLS